ncbi:MAG: M23 family metallopeptidase [Treponema sp.]|nr:M23 family metallopeptidase [Treponema sp.]
MPFFILALFFAFYPPALPAVFGQDIPAPSPDGAGEPRGQPAFPLITRLDPGDGVFRQYLADVETARLLLFSRRRSSPLQGAEEPELPGGTLGEALTIYAYRLRGEDLLSLAARCNVPYAALATLNRIPHPQEMAREGVFLLPSMPGLFVPEEPETDLERLLRSSRDGEGGAVITVRHDGKSGEGQRFLFLPGAEFTATERAFFLTRGFRFPLKAYRLTSGFGPRINPVTGNLRNHQGLDLAAPMGTEVYAARDGTVTDIGEDSIYGKYVIIRHKDNWTSLYGHLSEINTALRRDVQSGTLIGRVGSTGQSTGPHLHFELRQHGKAQDPGRLLF